MWRPHVVWFGEHVIGLDTIYEKLFAAELFVAIKISGMVFPANRFAAVAKAAGATTVEINLEPTGGQFDRRLIGPAARQVPLFVEELIEQRRLAARGGGE